MSVHPDVLATVEMSDLDGDMALVATECGFDTAISLFCGLAGIHVSVNKNALARTIRRYVVKNYTEYNAQQIALRCGISERHVYAIAKEAGLGRKKA